MTKARAKPPVAAAAPAPVETPAPVPLIADTIPADAICLLVGTPGSGRSSLLCEWAAAVALGDDWQGHPVERRRVAFLDASKERAAADTIEAVAGTEVPTEWLRVLPGRVALAGDDLGRWFDVIRAYAPGLILLDALGDLGRPSGGIDHPTWADGVAALAARLYDATAAGGAVVLAHTCDVRGAIAGAPLGDGVDVVLRLGRVGGRPSVRPVGPARSGRRRPPPPPAAASGPVYEPSGVPGTWADGEWMAADPTPLVSGRFVAGGYMPEAPR
jgi:hypothetical protein